jgi:hypothetical protein
MWISNQGKLSSIIGQHIMGYTMLKPSPSIKMVPQSIVDLSTGEIGMQEWLCRPKKGTLEEYFSILDPYELWLREAACIEVALDQPSRVPKLLNLTLSSLPYFLERNYMWNGGIELIEWGPRQAKILKILPLLLKRVRDRGLKIWVDDLSPSAWLQWKYAKVDGYKLVWEPGKKSFSQPFFKEVQSCGKPIIMERIEDQDTEEMVKNLGIKYGQGFYYQEQEGLIKR